MSVFSYATNRKYACLHYTCFVGQLRIQCRSAISNHSRTIYYTVHGMFLPNSYWSPSTLCWWWACPWTMLCIWRRDTAGHFTRIATVASGTCCRKWAFLSYREHLRRSAHLSFFSLHRFSFSPSLACSCSPPLAFLSCLH